VRSLPAWVISRAITRATRSAMPRQDATLASLQRANTKPARRCLLGRSQLDRCRRQVPGSASFRALPATTPECAPIHRRAAMVDRSVLEAKLQGAHIPGPRDHAAGARRSDPPAIRSTRHRLPTQERDWQRKGQVVVSEIGVPLSQAQHQAGPEEAQKANDRQAVDFRFRPIHPQVCNLIADAPAPLAALTSGQPFPRPSQLPALPG